MPGGVGVQNRITAEDVRLENAGKGPGRAAIGSIRPPRLPKVRSYAVELSPTDRHIVGIGWINTDRGLIGRVTQDIVSVSVDVHLITGVGTKRRYRFRGHLQPAEESRRVIVFFEMTLQQRLARQVLARRDLERKYRQKNAGKE